MRLAGIQATATMRLAGCATLLQAVGNESSSRQRKKMCQMQIGQGQTIMQIV